MKKKSVISLLTTAALLTSSFGALSVNAATQTVGTKQDFETAITTGDSLITQAQDENYGGVLNFASSSDNSGGTIWFDLDNAVSGGKYVLSFDAKMPVVGTETMLHFWLKDASGSQLSFTALRAGLFSTYDSANWQFPQIGNASYAANTWQKYDIIFDFAEGCAEVYTDGKYVGEINVSFDSIKSIGIAYIDYTKTGLAAQVDNLSICAVSDSAAMSASYTYKGKYEVTFSETMKDLDANDFTLTRVPTSGGSAETVLFDVDFMSTDKVILTPETSESGYTYTLSFADKKTAFGNSVSNRTFTKTMNKTVLNKSESFETASLSGNVATAEEQYRGKFMSYSGACDYNYKPDIALSGGQYIFSYDVRMDTTSGGYFLVRTYNSTTWDNYQAVWDNDRRFGDFTQNKGWGCTGYGVAMADTSWHRVDNIMDLDAKKSYIYYDGEKVGTADLSVRIPTGDTFNGAMISFSGTTGDVDNVRIKSVDNGYDAKISVKDDLIYIDFDETTYLKDGDYAVSVSTNPFAVTGDTVNAELVYNGGARAVLKLDEKVKAGTSVAVTLNNVKSFLGTELNDNVLTLSVPAAETTVTVVDDDMSSYAEQANSSGYLGGVGPWSNSETNGFIFTQDNKVGIWAGNSSYAFDEVSGGKATIKLDLNALEMNGKQGGYWLSFIDQDDNLWHTNVIFQAKIQDSIGWSDAITFADGDDFTIELEYDFATHKVTNRYTKGAETKEIANRTPGLRKASVSGTTPTVNDITGIKGIQFATTGGQYDTKLRIDNIKVTHTSTPSIIGDISFKDVAGNKVSVSDMKSTIGEMSIVFPDGLKNDSADGIISFNDGNFDAYSVSYDKATKTATVTFAEMLGANKSYSFTIKGAKTAEGDAYIEASGSFTTTAAVTEISDLAITRDGTNIKVGADFVNTASDKNYVMIYAAYNGFELVKMDFVPVNAVKNCKDTWIEHTFENADSSSYTKVTAFVWDSFAQMCPVTRSVTK